MRQQLNQTVLSKLILTIFKPKSWTPVRDNTAVIKYDYLLLRGRVKNNTYYTLSDQPPFIKIYIFALECTLTIGSLVI